MKDNHLTGLGVSAAIHVGLALLLAPVLFAQEPKQEEPPVLPVELSMFAPPAPEPVQEPAPQLAPEPPPPSPPPPPPKPKQTEKPKPKQDKPVEKPLPKPKPEKDLRKEQEVQERREEWHRQREAQQQQEAMQRQEQARVEAGQQARLRAQQQAARAAAQAQNETPLITNPSYRRPPRPPEYPRRALEAGVEGVVVVRANVSAGGNVTAARVHQSSGNAALDAAAVKAVRGWSFVPASRGGRSIESIVQTPVRFKIN